METPTIGVQPLQTKIIFWEKQQRMAIIVILLLLQSEWLATIINMKIVLHMKSFIDGNESLKQCVSIYLQKYTAVCFHELDYYPSH